MFNIYKKNTSFLADTVQVLRKIVAQLYFKVTLKELNKEVETKLMKII